MDEKELIEEVIRELKKKIKEEPHTGLNLKNAGVIGTLQEEERKALETAYRVTSFCKSGEYDILIIAQMSLLLLSNLALGIPGDHQAGGVLEALLKSKKVYLMEDGISYRIYKDTAFKTLYRLYQEYEDTIIKLGIEPIRHTAEIRREGNVRWNLSDTEYTDLTSLNLLRESDLIRVRNHGLTTIMLGEKAIITPLARDYISNHNLSVKRAVKR